MKIQLKSKRRYFVYWFIPFCVIISSFIIIMSVGQFSGYNTISDNTQTFYAFIFFDVLCILAIPVIVYYNGRSYIFTSEYIYLYFKGKLLGQIDVHTIQSMNYYPFRFHYYLTMFFGALNEGGAMKIHITQIDGNKLSLGLFSEKDAIMLQDMLYPDILVIMYDKRK